MLLFAEVPVPAPTDLVTGGVVVTLVGLIAWVLKSAVPAIAAQYRTDVFALTEKHAATVTAVVERFDAALERILKAGIEERKEKRLEFEAVLRDIEVDARSERLESRKEFQVELGKRDATIERVTAVLTDLAKSVHTLADEVRQLKAQKPGA